MLEIFSGIMLALFAAGVSIAPTISNPTSKHQPGQAVSSTGNGLEFITEGNIGSTAPTAAVSIVRSGSAVTSVAQPTVPSGTNNGSHSGSNGGSNSGPASGPVQTPSTGPAPTPSTNTNGSIIVPAVVVPPVLVVPSISTPVITVGLPTPLNQTLNQTLSGVTNLTNQTLGGVTGLVNGLLH